MTSGERGGHRFPVGPAALARTARKPPRCPDFPVIDLAAASMPQSRISPLEAAALHWVIAPPVVWPLRHGFLAGARIHVELPDTPDRSRVPLPVPGIHPAAASLFEGSSAGSGQDQQAGSALIFAVNGTSSMAMVSASRRSLSSSCAPTSPLVRWCRHDRGSGRVIACSHDRKKALHRCPSLAVRVQRLGSRLGLL